MTGFPEEMIFYEEKKNRWDIAYVSECMVMLHLEIAIYVSSKETLIQWKVILHKSTIIIQSSIAIIW